MLYRLKRKNLKRGKSTFQKDVPTYLRSECTRNQAFGLLSITARHFSGACILPSHYLIHKSIHKSGAMIQSSSVTISIFIIKSEMKMPLTEKLLFSL
uniref:Uncharacterized protein n=1 Tax=Oryzias latipes TaxID=8090 RepID=A0A3P9IPF0_ORYLA